MAVDILQDGADAEAGASFAQQPVLAVTDLGGNLVAVPVLVSVVSWRAGAPVELQVAP